MNKCFFVGRVSQDPEQRTTSGGLSVTTFSIAVNRRFNKEETDFFRIVTWRGLADNCAKYLEKGQQVSVIGEMHNRSFEDSNGQKRIITELVADEVEFLSKAGAAAGAKAEPKNNRSGAPDDDIFAGMEELMTEDELPF